MNALDALNDLLAREFPYLADHRVTELTDRGLTMRADPTGFQIRPGGTVSGPDQMRIADYAGYALVKHTAGHTLSVLLRNVSLSFLEAPAPRALTARATLLKLGKRTAEVRGDVLDDTRRLVATAALTYTVR
ncbi:PaaI family thioesterase [Streptomyces netropsis]|uniref:Acyl-coenzyme A thioesterase PaaI-like protein n=1 Tax=Streptomyces netropsis TaxID=55404 RepID=A0A7W7PDB6_STRNE|nr:PaaI family thioesterase [Streptomyces netropsis]MBB4885467.1 acyl-coenzyme A thioesterase PaaI-like protein [Streptomyces netropsis]GGR38377.1 thioesterase [Streptomyces netropsis]